MTKTYYKSIFLLTLVISCQQPITDNDFSKQQMIALRAEDLLTGSPEFFIPEDLVEPERVFWPPNITTKINSTGSVSWSYDGYVPVQGDWKPIEKSLYISRLNKSIVNNQGTYSEYEMVSGSGFAGYYWNENDIYYYFPPREFQNGFVCWALVYDAVKKAGFNWQTLGGVGFISNSSRTEEILDINLVGVGDIVIYDWTPDFNDGSDAYHTGIITDVSDKSNNGKNFKVVSSIGLVEIFLWGARETKVGVFGSIPNDGEFEYWNPTYDDYDVLFYKAKDEL